MIEFAVNGLHGVFMCQSYCYYGISGSNWFRGALLKTLTLLFVPLAMTQISVALTNKMQIVNRVATCRMLGDNVFNQS